MEIIRKLYCDSQYLGKFKLEKIGNNYIWNYVIDFTPQDCDRVNITEKRVLDCKHNHTWNDCSGIDNETWVIFSVDFEEGDL